MNTIACLISSDWFAANAADWSMVLITLVLAGLAYKQLRDANYNNRKWTTLQVCDRFDHSEECRKSQKVLEAVWYHEDRKCSDKDFDDALYHYFNCFDGVCIGVIQGLYIDEIVRDHLRYLLDNAMQLITDDMSSLDEGKQKILLKFRADFPKYFTCMHQKHREWNLAPESIAYKDR
jgi:hypothetical protein